MEILPASSSVADAALAQAKVDVSVRALVPYTQYEYVRVTFNSTANANTDVKHSLEVNDPEAIDFQVVGWEFAAAPGTVPVVYRDISATRRPWGTNYVVLRCNVASAIANVLLTVRPRRSQL